MCLQDGSVVFRPPETKYIETGNIFFTRVSESPVIFYICEKNHDYFYYFLTLFKINIFARAKIFILKGVIK